MDAYVTVDVWMNRLNPFLNLHMFINICLDFAERLYKKLEGCREKFDVRVMLMNLISRLIGIHKVMNNYVNLLTPYLVDIIEFLFLSSKILAATSKKLAPPPDVCRPLSLFLTPFSLLHRCNSTVDLSHLCQS